MEGVPWRWEGSLVSVQEAGPCLFVGPDDRDMTVAHEGLTGIQYFSAFHYLHDKQDEVTAAVSSSRDGCGNHFHSVAGRKQALSHTDLDNFVRWETFSDSLIPSP